MRNVRGCEDVVGSGQHHHISKVVGKSNQPVMVKMVYNDNIGHFNFYYQ